MKSKTPWTFENHVEAAQQLSQSRDQLGKLIVELSHSYSVNSKAIRLASKAQDILDALRCEMDEQLYRDNPTGFSPSMYYPHTPLLSPYACREKLERSAERDE